MGGAKQGAWWRYNAGSFVPSHFDVLSETHEVPVSDSHPSLLLPPVVVLYRNAIDGSISIHEERPLEKRACLAVNNAESVLPCPARQYLAHPGGGHAHTVREQDAKQR